MSTMMIQQSTRFARRTTPPPTPAEVDAMLQAVNIQLIQHDLAPDPALSPEIWWTIAALAAGGASGCLGAVLLIGGWLSALAGTVMGAASGGVFAVMLWRASDEGSSPGKPAHACRPLADDLLSGW